MGKLEGKYPVPDRINDDYSAVVDLIQALEVENALERLKYLLESDPKHPRLNVTLGQIHFHRHDLDEAEAVLSEVISEYSDFDEAYSVLSAVYAWKGNGEKAAENAEKALQLNPSSPTSWNALGMYYAKEYKYDTALEHFLAAYSMDRDYLTAAYNAACAYAVLGDTVKALEFLEKAFVSAYYVDAAGKDSDMDPLREDGNFEKLLSEARDRLKIKER
jgi:adenylate cyclase